MASLVLAPTIMTGVACYSKPHAGLHTHTRVHSASHMHMDLFASQESVYDKVKAEFIKRGAYFLNEEEKEKVRCSAVRGARWVQR